MAVKKNTTNSPVCPYCKRTAVLVDSEIIYRRSYGMIWTCDNCDAYVGCHKGTIKPLGTLANFALRWKRILTHQMFDALWKKK